MKTYISYKKVKTNNLSYQLSYLILIQYMQIIQKKGNMKNYFVIYIDEKFNLCE